MSTIIEQLQQLGFSQYEAQAYVALLQRNPLNGYELAKTSGIPRPNIYGVLQKLEERGAVVRLDTPEGTRYTPVACEELIDRIRNHFLSTLDAAKQSLNEVSSPAEQEYIWNARGYLALLGHAQAIVESAEKQLLIAIWPAEAQALGESVRQAEQRGVQVTTLCLAGCQQECSLCRGKVYRYPVAPRSSERWLVLVPDHAEVLAGEICSEDEALTVRTRQKMLVDLAAWYIRHSIALAALLKDAGAGLDPLLSLETRQILDSVGPGGEQGGWLEHMRQLLNINREKKD